MLEELRQRFNDCAFEEYSNIHELYDIVEELKQIYRDLTGKDFYTFGYPVNYMYYENYTYYFEHLKAGINSILILKEAEEINAKRGLFEQTMSEVNSC